MPVEADPEKRQIESISDVVVVIQAVLTRVGNVGIEKAKRRGWQARRIEQLVLQCVPGSAGIVCSELAELVEREHACTFE